MTRTGRVTNTTDVDGICLLSRNLDAFEVGTFGEERLYTNPKVNNFHAYLAKADFVDQATYVPDLRPYSFYMPGFKIIELPGAPRVVVDILNPDADPEEVREMRATPSEFARGIFHQVLNPPILLLPASSRSWYNNLADKTTETASLPMYYRL